MFFTALIGTYIILRNSAPAGEIVHWPRPHDVHLEEWAGAVNTFVYGPDLNNVEAELRALQQTAAEKNCPVNTTKASGKPEPGMGPIH